jgi:hypothetical protein
MRTEEWKTEEQMRAVFFASHSSVLIPLSFPSLNGS